MIKLHHLERSRSMRILWLLEEIGVPYELATYQRDPHTMRAPESLKRIHPLGKSPILEIDGVPMIESGAMVEWLIHRHAPHLAPDPSSPDYAIYLQWLHFAESSAMFPLIFKVLGQKLNLNDLENLGDGEIATVIRYIENYLDGKNYLVGDRLTGADFMMTYLVELLEIAGILSQFPNIERYSQNFFQLDSYKRAMKIEEKHRSQPL